MSQTFPQADGSVLILASASRTRRALLDAAGLAFGVIAADLDEDTMRQALDEVDPQDVAEILARAKAEAVSVGHPDAVVIGADQILALDGRIFTKPKDDEAARRQLLDLQGRTHTLVSAVAIARRGATVWTDTGAARLSMRSLTPEFIGRYLAAAGPRALESVGAYQLEGLGAHLFTQVDGDYFTVLGLPLLPLLEALRNQKVIEDR